MMNTYTYKKSSAVPFPVHNTCATDAEIALATDGLTVTLPCPLTAAILKITYAD